MILCILISKYTYVGMNQYYRRLSENWKKILCRLRCAGGMNLSFAGEKRSKFDVVIDGDDDDKLLCDKCQIKK
jgi:hypothetical protein